MNHPLPVCIIMHLLLSRPDKAGLIVRLPVHTSTKSSYDFNEISSVGRGRWVLHDGMSCDPIQGQGQGLVTKMADVKVSFLSCYACNQKTNSELW